MRNTDTGNRINPKYTHRLSRKLKIILVILCALVTAYIILVNVLVSAALLPSFMERLDAFEDITVKSYSEQVKSTDISDNRTAELDETDQWLTEVSITRLNEKTDDGYNLYASEFLQDTLSHQWVLVLHGYTGWKEEMYPFACRYYQEGYNCIVPDMRCSGESEGDFIGMGWTDHYDCEKWISYILEQDPDAEIIIHGQSMGASTALMMSGDPDLPDNVVAVVSDAAYTDAYSMFGDKITEWFHLPAFPLVDSARLALILRGGYDLNDASALDAVSNSHTPTLFIHGDKDKMIDVDMCYELYENCSADDKEILIIKGAGHGQTQEKDPDLYYSTIWAFIENATSEK